MANYSAPYGVGALNTFNERDGFLEAGTMTNVSLCLSHSCPSRPDMQCCVAIGGSRLVQRVEGRVFFVRSCVAALARKTRRATMRFGCTVELSTLRCRQHGSNAL